jgi:hypothetical protein
MFSDKLRKGLIRLIKEVNPYSSINGTVKAVDLNDFTCDVEPVDGGAIYNNVRLKCTINGMEDGIIMIPDVGSSVIISNIKNDPDNYYVNRFEKVVKYALKLVGGGSIVFDSSGNITLNGGLLGGIVKINELKQELLRLETNINAIKTAAGVAIAVYSGALDGGVSASAYNSSVSSLAPQNLINLENQKVKHG